MNNFLDELREAWQSQCGKPIDVNPDQLLKTARNQRLVQFCLDIGMISFFFCVGILMVGWAFRDIQKEWPWLITSASVAWVAGYILFNRWRRRPDAAHYDEPLLAHVEWSIGDIERQMWLDRYSPWWYILPLALGCMIPPLFFFAMDYSNRPLLDRLMPLLSTEVVFVVTFIYGYLLMKFGVRMAVEKRRQELRALRRFEKVFQIRTNKSHD